MAIGEDYPYRNIMYAHSNHSFNKSDYLSDDLDHFQPFVYTNSGRGYQLENGSLGNSDKRYQALPNT